MKKALQISLVIAGIISCIGCILLIIGSAMGGIELFKKAIVNGVFSYQFDNFSLINGDSSFDTDFLKEVTFEESIASIKIEGDCAELEIEPYNGTEIKIEYTGKLETEVVDTTLKIATEDHKTITSGIDFFGIKNTKVQAIRIFVPENYIFEELDIKLDAGQIETKLVKGNEIVIEVDAVDVDMEAFDVNRLAIDVDAGNVELEGTVRQEAIFNMDLGNMNYEGSILKNLQATSDMGNMIFELLGNENDHNYNLSCNMGKIEALGYKAAGTGFEKIIDNGKPESLYVISCDMGNVELEFE